MNRRDALKTIGVSCATIYFPIGTKYPVAEFDGIRVVPVRVHWNPHDHWVDDPEGNDFILRSEDYCPGEESCFMGFYDLTREFRNKLFGDDFEKKEMTRRIFVRAEDAILYQHQKEIPSVGPSFTVQNYGMQSIYGPVDIVSNKERIDDCDVWITEVVRVPELSKVKKDYF
jgi:hypothetical protein